MAVGYSPLLLQECQTRISTFQYVYDSDKRNDNDDDDGDDGENDVLALQVIRDNNRFRILDGEVEGQIAVGEKDIEKNNWKDFSVEDTFNTCRTLAYSSSPDVKIQTPLPTVALSDSKRVTQPLPPYCYYPYYDPRCGGGIGVSIPGIYRA